MSSHNGTIMVPKELNFGPKCVFWDAIGLIWAQILLAYWVSRFRRAGCISKDTYLLYIILYYSQKSSVLLKLLPYVFETKKTQETHTCMSANCLPYLGSVVTITIARYFKLSSSNVLVVLWISTY